MKKQFEKRHHHLVFVLFYLQLSSRDKKDLPKHELNPGNVRSLDYFFIFD